MTICDLVFLAWLAVVAAGLVMIGGKEVRGSKRAGRPA